MGLEGLSGFPRIYSASGGGLDVMGAEGKTLKGRERERKTGGCRANLSRREEGHNRRSHYAPMGRYSGSKPFGLLKCNESPYVASVENV